MPRHIVIKRGHRRQHKHQAMISSMLLDSGPLEPRSRITYVIFQAPRSESTDCRTLRHLLREQAGPDQNLRPLAWEALEPWGPGPGLFGEGLKTAGAMHACAYINRHVRTNDNMRKAVESRDFVSETSPLPRVLRPAFPQILRRPRP